MARPAYQQQSSNRGHQARGLDRETQQSLEESNLLRKRSSEKKTRSRKPKPKKEAPEAPAVKKPDAEVADLPRRSRRKIPRQSRHFRLPIAIDNKLIDIVDHYDASMVWVLSRMVQEEWVRIKRKERRAEKDQDSSDGDARTDAANGQAASSSSAQGDS